MLLPLLSIVTKKPIAPTPIRGVTTWNTQIDNVDEIEAGKIAHFLSKEGFQAAGYEYFMLPDGFLSQDRNATGYLVSDPVKFPKGILSFSNYLHELGLKLGIQVGTGTRSCSGKPGILNSEQKDIETFIEWEVDFISFEMCGLDTDIDFKDQMKKLTDIIAKQKRNIVIEVNDYGQTKAWTWASTLAHQWRTSYDISYVKNQCDFKSIVSIYEQNVQLAEFSGPNQYNFADVLCTDMPGFSDAQSKTQMALWTIMNSPLIIGANISKMLHSNIQNLIHENIIRIHSDSLSVQGVKISNQSNIDVIARPLDDGSVAIVIFNKNADARNVQVPLKAISSQISIQDADIWNSAKSFQIMEVWTYETTSAGTRLSVSELESFDTAIFIVKPE